MSAEKVMLGKAAVPLATKIRPVAEINPPVRMLPPVVFPLTDKFPSVPTDVRLENKTLELNVLPVNALAFTLLAVTLVSWLPLPMK